MEALYLKYRPKSFDEIIGQDEISKTLSNAIRSQKIPHSYLFYGPRGCGKTSTARILAKALNCHNRVDVNPCNECISCREISNSSSIDVMEIDAASHTQVQNVRDVIIDSVNLSPARDRYKIYILDEVHMLSNSAFNALLKTIEEPPSHVIFILATTEINKVPITIISRCQSFRFKPLSRSLIVERLKHICKNENIHFDEEALNLIADNANGALRDAIGLLEKISAFSNLMVTTDITRQILGYPKEEIIKSLALAIINRDIRSVHSLFEEIRKEGYDVFSVLREIRDIFLKTFLYLNSLYSGSDVLMVKEQDLNPFLLPKLSRKVNRIIDEVRYSENPTMLAEIFVYTIIDSVDIEALIKNLSFESQNQQIPKKLDSSKDEKSVEGFEDKKSENKFNYQDLWRKILNCFMNENYLIYNIFLSSKVDFDGNSLIIIPSSDTERDILKNKFDFIESKLSGYGLKLVIEDKKKAEVDFIRKDIQGEEVYFPEYEKIKKVFGEYIIKVTKNDFSSKVDR